MPVQVDVTIQKLSLQIFVVKWLRRKSSLVYTRSYCQSKYLTHLHFQWLLEVENFLYKICSIIHLLGDLTLLNCVKCPLNVENTKFL